MFLSKKGEFIESLKFKVILGTSERREAFLKAIKKAGVNGYIVDADFLAGANFAWLDYKFRENSFFYNTTNHCNMFEDCEYPLIRLCEAIARLEKYAAGLQPEFNIKPGDDVLVRDRSDRPWRIARFSYINESLSAFACESEWRQLAFYKGNESSVGKFSDIDFWYVKNGKPELIKGENK
ncbi:MAG: hypothetical protein BWY02_02978 [bacterium ADurb.Bin157]|nr:MAG: hypothetical protein BWY02_02978 [bacterium ADurb.Bin157]